MKYNKLLGISLVSVLLFTGCQSTVEESNINTNDNNTVVEKKIEVKEKVIEPEETKEEVKEELPKPVEAIEAEIPEEIEGVQAQCYDCGIIKKVNEMDFDGRCYHCGCDGLCSYCYESIKPGDKIRYIDDMDYCSDCIKRIAAETNADAYCNNCGEFIESSDIYYDSNNNCLCINCR